MTINCSSRNCVWWVANKCGASEISLSEVPNNDYGVVVICETFEAGRAEPCMKMNTDKPKPKEEIWTKQQQ